MNEISSLPSLNDLLTQNPNLRPNGQLDRFAKSSEMGQSFGASPTDSVSNGVAVVPIDKTSPTERVTAPGFAQMFENFIKGVDQKKKISKNKIIEMEIKKTGKLFSFCCAAPAIIKKKKNQGNQVF